MDFNWYQNECAKTDVGTSAQDCIKPGWMYYVLGAGGETGELLEKVKKLFRDKKGVIDDEFRDAVIKETGDVWWYHARMLSKFGISMSEVAEANIEKLQSRMERDTLHGDGDDR